MARDREQDRWDKLNQPPRQQDPYVTGKRKSYGGEVQGSDGSSSSNESCGGEAAKMVIVGATVVALAVKALKMRRK